MARRTNHYICQSCGASFSQWAGRCGACGEWNTIVEEAADPIAVTGQKKGKSKRTALELETLDGATEPPPRLCSDVKELDQVLGGGFVPGSAILIGGNPGIGKSTLLMQVAARFARNGQNVLYFSGEEATDQLRLRAGRLKVNKAPVGLAAETNLEAILATLRTHKDTDICIIDSIQTLWSETLDAAPGTVSQLRATTQSLIRQAKRSNMVLVIVGHVTKDGTIAGPKVIEHMVDTVLYFEGQRGGSFRLLRAIKNRFGPADEIGIFEMTDGGLVEVKNPSSLFLSNNNQLSPGTAVFAGIEGTRPVLVEIQALVAPSPYGTPRRAVVGWDNNRLSMILAVLEARCSVSIGAQDIYLNVAGGMRITEPAGDLAVASALLSSLYNKPLPEKCVFFGEIGLSGILRPVTQIEARLKEAHKLGFKRAYLPLEKKKKSSKDLAVMPYKNLSDLIKDLF